MKIRLIWPGKTKNKHLSVLLNDYLTRIKRFIPVDLIEFKSSSDLSDDVRKNREGEEFLKRISAGDTVVLLSEFGKEYTSHHFSQFIEDKMIYGGGNLTFLVGGESGFSAAVTSRGFKQIALSQMTLTHDFARVILAEQIYRAFTIIRNIKYQR